MASGGLRSSGGRPQPTSSARQPRPACRHPDQATCSRRVNDAPVVARLGLSSATLSHRSLRQANYSITRDGIQLDTPVVVIPEPPDRSLQQALRVIGLIYLAIGIYVLFRRWTAPRATHFYLFCLVSFALYALKYTGA